MAFFVGRQMQSPNANIDANTMLSAYNMWHYKNVTIVDSSSSVTMFPQVVKIEDAKRISYGNGKQFKIGSLLLFLKYNFQTFRHFY